MNEQERHNYPKIFYEDKKWLLKLIIVGSVLFFFEFVYLFYREVLNNYGTIAVLIITTILITLVYKFSLVSSITIYQDKIKYKKGNIKWEAFGEEIKSLNRTNGILLIETNKGWTKEINIPLITTKDDQSKSLFDVLSLSTIQFRNRIHAHNNPAADELLKELSRISKKDIKPYSIKGWEKIRKSK